MPPKDAAAGPSRGGGGDRLGGLPDAVLRRVLSHLKAWRAVRTCLFSKRWRGLCLSARRLDIRQPCECKSQHPVRSVERREVFAAFVRNLLLRQPALDQEGVDALRLCWSHKASGGGDANTSIAHVVRRGAEEIELSGTHDDPPPRPKYTSFIVTDDTDVKIRLKTVKLIHVDLGGSTLTLLSSRCTRLEELELKDCVIPQAAEILSTSLKHFTMIKCQILGGLSIYAPNLVHVSLRCSGRNNINSQAMQNYPDYFRSGSCNLQILKISRIHLKDTALTQFCSRCTSLQELELWDCLVDGKEIKSTSLKCLTMISCRFVKGFRINALNLVLLWCIRPFGFIPLTQNMGFLVTAAIVLDDSCCCMDYQWPPKEDDEYESDHDGNFFNTDDTGDSDDNKNIESDDTSDYYDPGWSGRSSGGNSSINFGSDGMLHSLSDVQKMALFAHPEEMVLTRELKLCPDFKNLKTLSLDEWCITPQFDELATILRRSPNLENLFLHLDMASRSMVDFDQRGCSSSFSCTNLKMVKITCSNCVIMLDNLVKFFGANGITREKISVHRFASTDNVKGGVGSQSKRKAQGEAEDREAKQRKAGN